MTYYSIIVIKYFNLIIIITQ